MVGSAFRWSGGELAPDTRFSREESSVSQPGQRSPGGLNSGIGVAVRDQGSNQVCCLLATSPLFSTRLSSATAGSPRESKCWSRGTAFPKTPSLTCSVSLDLADPLFRWGSVAQLLGVGTGVSGLDGHAFYNSPSSSNPHASSPPSEGVWA